MLSKSSESSCHSHYPVSMNLKWGFLNELEETVFMHVSSEATLNSSLFLFHLISDEEIPDVDGTDALFETSLASDFQ